MSRLTTHIRESLLKKLLKRAFFERAQACVDMQADFVKRVYEDALKEDLPKLASIPKSWIYTTNSFKVSMAGEVVELRPGLGLSYSFPHEFHQAGAKREHENWPIPYNRRSSALVVYDANHPLSLELTRHRNAQDDLKTEIERASRQAAAAMGAVGTVKKLISIWPEVEDLAKEYLVEGERVAILPAIPRDLLNKMLDLPPEVVAGHELAGGTVVA